ncbi:hypothetical protein BJ170DRAFT_677581 [Xylariales sp. AK1849]|nr:hypothetical protein BJ170DRAFT_677581 [Xylariales sp. AK1849]
MANFHNCSITVLLPFIGIIPTVYPRLSNNPRFDRHCLIVSLSFIVRSATLILSGDWERVCNLEHSPAVVLGFLIYPVAAFITSLIYETLYAALVEATLPGMEYCTECEELVPVDRRRCPNCGEDGQVVADGEAVRIEIDGAAPIHPLVDVFQDRTKEGDTAPERLHEDVLQDEKREEDGGDKEQAFINPNNQQCGKDYFLISQVSVLYQRYISGPLNTMRNHYDEKQLEEFMRRKISP